jgi:hypothetical protein
MFNHYMFFPYLTITALIYWLLPSRRIRTGFLTLCSLAAIWYMDPRSVAVVIGMTVFTYLAAGWIERAKNPKLAFKTGIFWLLAIIVIFKYLGLLTATLNSLTAFASFLPAFRIEKLFLPLGISYITFKYISYLSDVRSGVVQRGRWLDFACYGSLYTIFVAGPIERFEILKPQLESEDCSFRDEYLNTALERMLFGMFKKLVLADWLALIIQPVWQSPELFSLSARVLALMGFSMQIYFDFSGYSDVAIGASRLYGIQNRGKLQLPLPGNQYQPVLAKVAYLAVQLDSHLFILPAFPTQQKPLLDIVLRACHLYVHLRNLAWPCLALCPLGHLAWTGYCHSPALEQFQAQKQGHHCSNGFQMAAGSGHAADLCLCFKRMDDIRGELTGPDSGFFRSLHYQKPLTAGNADDNMRSAIDVWLAASSDLSAGKTCTPPLPDAQVGGDFCAHLAGGYLLCG